MLAPRFAEGTNVATLPLATTVPATGALPVVTFRVKLEAFSVEIFIGSEKVTDIDEFNATSISEFSGDVSDTAGRIVSGTPGANPATNDGESPSPPLPPPQPYRPRLAIKASRKRMLLGSLTLNVVVIQLPG